MKLITSLLIFLKLSTPNITFARDIILIENLGDKIQAKVLIGILSKKYQWPQGFIAYREKAQCSKAKDALLQICLLKNGEIEVVKENKELLERLNQVFSETGDKNEI